jgi:peptide/nickel transport system substrate-binding protein
MRRCLALLVLAVLTAVTARAEETLRVGMSALPPGLGSPYASGGFPGIDLYGAMFDGLGELREDGVIAPALATSWTASDPLTWVFTLRPGVRFANGAAFDARTVEAIFAILTSPEAQGWSVVREVRNIAAVTARDPLTLEVRTRTPDLMLPARFAAIKMIEPAYWQQVGADAFARAPVGTGPYVVKRWANQQIELIANPQAWRKPKVPKLTIRAVPETAARVAGVQTGALDVGLNLGPEDIDILEASGGRMATYPQGGVLGLSYILVKANPFADVRVRQALTYAVDRELIVRTVFAGKAKAASQASASMVFGHDPTLKPYPYNPEKARRLLAEAGFADGFAFTADVLVVSSTDAAVWQKVAQDLAAVGVTMTVNALPFPRYNQGLYQGTWSGDAFGMNYGSLPALDPMVGFQYHSCLWLKPWICDQAQTDLIKSIMTEFDRPTREGLTRKLMRITYDAPIGLYLYEASRFDGLGPRVTTYRSPFGMTAYHDIGLK